LRITRKGRGNPNHLGVFFQPILSKTKSTYITGDTVMLGDFIGELKGKITGQRVLSVVVPGWRQAYP